MNTWIEWFGTLASVVVAVSLTMKNIKRLRTVNLIGSLAFALYGFLISAWPVFGLNAFIVVVNVYYLARMRQAEARSETFDVLFVDPSRDEYARRFLETHLADIRRYFPSFSMDEARADPRGARAQPGTLSGAEACFILREALPVSLVAFRRAAGDEIELLLDYAVPAFRDYKSARFFFDIAAARFAADRISAIPGSGAFRPLIFTATSEVAPHTAYLIKMGFTETAEPGRFRKEVLHEA